ncbi:von Willebrand factor C domain-containing protein 2-like [Gigantopelta aegis]|uniref:von Willebrand factor C domain-containing protein 2-like n=1 Tax=Gigantopelta aegis TaxID=1735272 RepID=UPI001B88CF67|nr:von Willebrand factor C domain-containing protein 2-like [Gigantopelta aegis]
MLSYTLVALSWTVAFTSAHPPYPTTPPLPPHCELEGKIYRPGQRIPTSDRCELCTCEDTGYSVDVSCIYADYLTPMCYNPVYNGENACQKYTCPVRNCRTPSGHVLIGHESTYFQDDGFCSCPPQSHDLPGDQWKPVNGMALCFPPTTTPTTTVPTTTTASRHLVG